MNERPESKLEKAEKPVKELELNQETVQDLSETDAEAAKGGYVMPPRLSQVMCR